MSALHRPGCLVAGGQVLGCSQDAVRVLSDPAKLISLHTELLFQEAMKSLDLLLGFVAGRCLRAVTRPLHAAGKPVELVGHSAVDTDAHADRRAVRAPA